LITARIANAMEDTLCVQREKPYTDQFQEGWQSEEDAFRDGNHQNTAGGKFVG